MTTTRYHIPFNPKTCQWIPVTEERTGFCNCKVLPGSAYCETHHNEAHFNASDTQIDTEVDTLFKPSKLDSGLAAIIEED